MPGGPDDARAADAVPAPPPPLPYAPERVTAGDGVRLAAYRFGGDGPPLLLAHATGFHAHVWLPLLGALRERFTVYEALGRDLLAVADHFRLAWPSG